MTLLQAAILGLVEGLTEFLPVSSTGHMIMASRLLGLASSDFVKSFEIAIQLGAIAAVAALYWRRFLLDREVLKKVMAAFLPTAILGFLFHDFIKTYLLGADTAVVWTLALGGLVMIAFEIWHRPSVNAVGLEAISYRQAVIIGLCQSLAMVPGVSRSAATIVGGLALGVRRPSIVEFSFLLAVPTMVAATGLDLVKSAGTFSSADAAALAVGFLVSFFVAIAAVRFFLSYVQHHDFKAFGVYRIAAAFAYLSLIA